MADGHDDRWLAWCRRRVPASLRATAFDPAVEDLRRELACAGASPLRWRLALLRVAIQCRVLPADAAPSVSPAFRSRFMLSRIAQDVRLALRRLRREPLFVLVASLTLALGIGTNVAVFSFVNAFVLAPVPWPHSSQLVRVYGGTPRRPFEVMSYPDYVDLRDRLPAVDLAARATTSVIVGGARSTEARDLELVTGNYFRIVGMAPELGRWLDARDEVAEGADPVVVISDALWRAHFGASPSAIGQTIRLNGAPYDVVGVAPPGLTGSLAEEPVELWAPIVMQQQLRPRDQHLTQRTWGWLDTIGRARPGAPLAEIQDAVDAAARSMNRERAADDQILFTAALASALDEPTRRALLPYARIAFAFTGVLLLVACANLAGVMRTRFAARTRELAIRQSLGARRRHIAGAWLVESVVLAIPGAAGGVMLTALASAALVRHAPPAALTGGLALRLPIDARVLAFAGLLAAGVAVVCGLVPAVRAASGDPLGVLKDETGTVTGGRGARRARRSAVLVQVAASAALLLVSALLMRSLSNMESLDLGFRIDHVAVALVNLPASQFPEAAAAAFMTNLGDRLRGRPDLTEAAFVTNLPLTRNRDAAGFAIPGHPAQDGSPYVSISYNEVSSSYFEALGLNFLRGHTWDPAHVDGAIVINDTMARQYWGTRDPVGAVLQFPVSSTDIRPLTVVGVVRDSTYLSLGDPAVPFVYLPAEMTHPRRFFVAARTRDDVSAALPVLAQAIANTDPRVKPLALQSFESARQLVLYPKRMLASAAAAFGALALLLAGVGVYGVVSAMVDQRTREIGVRLALGARPIDVQRDVVREAARLVLAGALVGLAGAYFLAGGLHEWLFHVGAFDPAAYASVLSVLAVLAIAAAWVPARRAAGVDPVKALRQ